MNLPHVVPSSDAELPAHFLSGRRAERPRDLPPSGVLIALRSIQHVRVSKGRFQPSWSTRLVMAKWVLSGQAMMELEGRQLIMEPGNVAIYLPTNPHRFWALEEGTELCWLTIDGSMAEAFALELGLQAGVYPVSPPSPDDIEKLAQSLDDSSLPARRKASELAIAEWYRLANAIRAPVPVSLADQIKFIICQEFANSELSTKLIARRIGYHRGSISQLFHKRAGETIISYLTKIRLREARALLAHTNESVAEIGRQCGFREPAYFCRWFRKHTGVTPGAFATASKNATPPT